jgi:hypothetical protein
MAQYEGNSEPRLLLGVALQERWLTRADTGGR